MYTWVGRTKKLFDNENKIGNKYYTFWVCVCSLSYIACNRHAPYCHLWPAPLYNTSKYYLINDAIFEGGKTFFYIKSVFGFSLQNLSETFLILRRTQRGMNKHVNDLHVKYALFLSDFNENLNFLDGFFEKSWNILFHENPSGGRRVVPCGRTDGHHEANSRFSQFCGHP